MARVSLIGDVCVDVTLVTSDQENKMRLGGIMHAARALWAIDVGYDLYYIAPDYFVAQIEDYASKHGVSAIVRIGTVTGAPNVILIGEPKEVGAQGYDMLIRDDYNCEFDSEKLEILAKTAATDHVIFPANFDLEPVLNSCKQTQAKVHIDIANGTFALTALNSFGRKFDTIFTSTSSPLFLTNYAEAVTDLRDELLNNYCHNFLFKENRGGSRFFRDTDPDNPLFIDAQIRPIAHSIGVGDCFDVAFVALLHQHDYEIALNYASWLATEYAVTTYPDDFKQACKNTLAITPDEITKIKGISLPWEIRQQYQIYIAAPDFDYVDTAPIDQVAAALRYHNFKPRLPVRENGQMGSDATWDRKQQLCEADLQILRECQLLIAVIINNDPGTLIEIGLAVGWGIPVIAYDPYNKAQNLMLTQLPHLLSSDLDSIIAKVFEIISKVANNDNKH